MEVLIFWIICAIVGAIIGSRKERGGMGFLLGLLLGPLGALCAFALDGRMMCAECNSRLNGKPNICPFCKAEYKWD